MKRNIVLAALALILMISCKSKPAFDYSETIVKMENDLAAAIAKADLKVTEYLSSQKKDSAILMSQQMESLADIALKKIQQLEAPKVKEGDNFKKEAVRYFSYIKSIYTSFNKFTRATTDEQKEIERERLGKIIKDKKEATEAMQEAQRKFAAANDFRIQKVSPGKSEK